MLSKEQHALRRTGICASDFPVLVYDQYFGKTKLDLYNYIKNGPSQEENISINMLEGNYLEPMVAYLFWKKTGIKPQKHQDTMVYCKDNIKLIATPDFTLKENDDTVLLETKVVSYEDEAIWGEENTDEMPAPYLLQVAQNCLVLNLKKAYLCAYFKFKQKIKIYTYNKNEEIEGNIFRIASDFWKNYIITNTPPPPSNLNDIKNIKHTDPDSVFVSDTQTDEIIETIKSIRHQKNQLSAREEKLKCDLLMKMGDASAIVDFNGKKLAQMVKTVRQTLKKDAFKNDFKDIAHKYIEEKTFYHFKIGG